MTVVKAQKCLRLSNYKEKTIKTQSLGQALHGANAMAEHIILYM